MNHCKETIADCAKSIHNEFDENLIESGVHGTSWFHCKKAIDNALACVKELGKKASLLAGIYQLKISQTPDIFSTDSCLLFEEWFQTFKLSNSFIILIRLGYLTIVIGLKVIITLKKPDPVQLIMEMMAVIVY